MLKLALFLCLAGYATAQVADRTGGAGPYIWDILPPPLTAEEVIRLLEAVVAGETFPLYNEVPETSFTCDSVNQAGYYADQDAGCQVIRRCTVDGNMFSFLCPNATLFNQLTLVCDWWYNVDCAKAREQYDFANPWIYTQGEALHDSPPEGYVPEYLSQAGAANDNKK